MNSLEGFTVDYRQDSTIFDRRQSVQSSGGKWERALPISRQGKTGGTDLCLLGPSTASIVGLAGLEEAVLLEL